MEQPEQAGSRHEAPEFSPLEQARRSVIEELRTNPPEQIVNLTVDEGILIVDMTIDTLTRAGLIKTVAMKARGALGVRDSAELLDVHENTLRRWEKKGLIKAVKLPTGVRRFRLDDIKQMRREMWDDIADEAVQTEDEHRRAHYGALAQDDVEAVRQRRRAFLDKVADDVVVDTDSGPEPPEAP